MRKFMTTAQQVYSNEVSILPPSEQLRLATLILAGLSETSAAAMDFSDEWSDEDLRDLGAFAIQKSAEMASEEEC
jgi:hypothetical protein